jgi:hypothetical protein
LEARDIFRGELLGVIMHVRAACESESARLGEGVIAVQHDAVEVESAAIGGNVVADVVVAEGDGELAGPAGAAVEGGAPQ